LNCKAQNQLNCLVLNELVTDLCEAERMTFNKIIQVAELPAEELIAYSSWSDDTYTRNCIYEDEDFELILLCWKPGQSTPIHDHGGEECWVKVIEGAFKERIFQHDEAGDLQEISSSVTHIGDVSYMIDFMGYHSLENISPGNSMTLHLYAKPIKNCHIFDEDSQCLIYKEMSYDTVLS
jgi:cysteine dioxygenase